MVGVNYFQDGSKYLNLLNTIMSHVFKYCKILKLMTLFFVYY